MARSEASLQESHVINALGQPLVPRGYDIRVTPGLNDVDALTQAVLNAGGSRVKEEHQTAAAGVPQTETVSL